MRGARCGFEQGALDEDLQVERVRRRALLATERERNERRGGAGRGRGGVCEWAAGAGAGVAFALRSEGGVGDIVAVLLELGDGPGGAFAERDLAAVHHRSVSERRQYLERASNLTIVEVDKIHTRHLSGQQRES